jgi:predicted enzyme related to lactoylglutathione lyase
MFQGLRTVIYHVDDLGQAKDWYSSVLGFAPYFDQPFYVGFNVGGFELGLDPDMDGVSRGTNEVAYWGASDAEEEIRRLIELGAEAYRSVQDVGDGIRVGIVKDPFGTLIGVLENPHFKMEPQ